MSQTSISFARQFATLAALVVLVSWSSTAQADQFTELDRLRILTQNVANKPWPFKANIASCGDDNRCRARLIAEKIGLGDYDVVVMEEQFDDDGMEELIIRLGDTFPYYAGQFDDGAIAQPWLNKWKEQIAIAAASSLNPVAVAAALALMEFVERLTLQNSGLVIFSKWPLISFAKADPDDFDGCSYKMDDKTWEKSTFHSSYPAVFVRYDRCYQPWLGDKPTIEEALGELEHISDCFASKGVGAVRLLSPTGRIFNVIFTHTQASYGGVPLSSTSDVRRAQMEQVNKLIEDLHIDTDFEEVLFAGDLNINGNQVQLVDSEVADKNDEWKNLFDMGLPSGNNNAPFFPAARTLKDSWPYSMNVYHGSLKSDEDPHVRLDPGLTWTGESSGGSGNGRLDYIFLGQTAPSTRRLPMAVHHAAVSYNIGDPLSSENRNYGITSASSPGLAMHGGLAPISDHWGLSAEIAPATRFHNPVEAYAVNPRDLCEHVNTCENDPSSPTSGRCGLSKQECTEDSDCACLQTIFNTFEQPGTAHWYRIDSPGTYIFRVNHMFDSWALDRDAPPPSDNGLHYEIYQPSDLSRPYQPFGDLTSKSDPGGPCEPDSANNPDPKGNNAAGCAFESASYDVREAPFYVKVWYDDTDWQLKDYPFVYDFTWQRNGCESGDQACALYPSEELVDDYALWRGASGSSRWFAVRVDRSDSGLLQHLRFNSNAPIVANEGPRIDSITLMDSDKATVLGSTKNYLPVADVAGFRAHFQMYSENNVPPGSNADSVGTIDSDDKTFYLVVGRNPHLKPPQDFDYQARWDTDLTWILGSENAHRFPANTPAPGWNIALSGETQDNDILFVEVHDEISWEWVVDSDEDCSAGMTCALVFVDMHVPDDKGDLPVVIGDAHNVWGERVDARKAFRYVKKFRARIWEWDSFLTGDNDIAGWGAWGPMFPPDTLQGLPDPDTANHLIERPGGLHIGWGADDGNYFLRANRANSTPTKFCMSTNRCDGRAFCCSKKRACVRLIPGGVPGGSCND